MISNPQTSVDLPTIGVAGQPADFESERFGDRMSATSAESSANIPTGIMVKRGSVDGTANLLTGAGDVNVLLGVTLFDYGYDQPSQLDADGSGFLPETTFSVQRTKRIVVITEANVTPTSEVHVRHTVNGAGHLQVGAFLPTADANKTIDMSAFASWQGTYAAGLAVLEIDMANLNLAAADT